MTFFKFVAPEAGQSYNYPTLGIIANDGAILDGTASTPNITAIPDANWTVVASGPESGITRYRQPQTPPDDLSSWNGSLLVYDATQRAYVRQLPSQVVDSTTAIGGALAGAFVAVAPKPTGVAATDTANLLNAASKAAAAAAATGLAKVRLQAGVYKLNQALPVQAGVHWVGVEPVIGQSNNTTGTWISDTAWIYLGGTVLQGDGTFACFEANGTDQGAVPASLGSTAIQNWGIDAVGLDNFTYGIHVGAANIMGLTWSHIGRVWVSNCTQWGVRLVNFAHIAVDRIYVCNCAAGGQYYGTNLPASALQPGNSEFGELYTITPSAARTARGFVMEAIGTSASLDELVVRRLQVNGYGRTLRQDTVILTSGSANITVPDGTQYVAGMPVQFSATVGGFTAQQCYIVKSVVGNVITLGNTVSDATTINATSSTTGTLQSAGMSNIELNGYNPSGNIVGVRLLQVDTEGANSLGMYAENFSNAIVTITDTPAGGPFSVVVGRKFGYSIIQNVKGGNLDLDANSGTSWYFGAKNTTIQRSAKGMWQDITRGTSALSVSNSGAGNGSAIGDIESRAQGFLYPNFGLGEHIFPRDAALTLNAQQAGDVIFSGSSAVTMTLPTIISDATPNTSHIGLWFDFINVGTGALTVATDGTQLFNKTAAKTSISVPAGSSVRVIAAKDASGTLFWVAKAVQTLS